jgi:hypothetical protein
VANGFLQIAEELLASLSLDRTEIFIFNVLKYRPFGDKGAQLEGKCTTRPYHQSKRNPGIYPYTLIKRSKFRTTSVVLEVL